MNYITNLLEVFVDTFFDVLPIIIIIFGFQFLVIRKPVANLKKVVIGFVYVLVGLTFFLEGLEVALFPIGKLMATQLTNPEFIHGKVENMEHFLVWQDYYYVYLFAAAIGFSTTVAEPSLLAVAIKAEEVSAGAISIWGLRIAVAIGVATGITLGTFRIVTGTPLHYYIITGYIIVILQTTVSPKSIIALAFDSGGVTTSTVTVPIVAALGLGLASTVPGRSPLIDGFGLIAFASLFPMMSVMGYAQISHWRVLRARKMILQKGD